MITLLAKLRYLLRTVSYLSHEGVGADSRSIPTQPKDGYFLHALHVSAKNIIYLHKAR